MDPDMSNGSNCQVPLSKEKNLVARPVAAGSSGEGLPYAPEDWPCSGDKWRWKVGKRLSASGFWCDRYLYPPPHLMKATHSGRKQGFASRLLVEQFVSKEFPDADVQAFFASFIWKIPSSNLTQEKDTERCNPSQTSNKRSQPSEHSESESAPPGAGNCKAGNKMCRLCIRARSYSSATMDCDICCSETGFCRDCCCILCCKTIDWVYGGYSSIRCEATVDRNFICGHVAHMDCALRANLAGTVGGSIGLDVEYYCRRCDSKTDLVSHVTKLLHTCESLDSQEEIEKMLNLGLCILRGSEQMRAKSLRVRIEAVMAKLRSEVYLGEIWKDGDNFPEVTAGNSPHIGNGITMLGTLDNTTYQKCVDVTNEFEPSHGNEIIDGSAMAPVYITSDHSIASVKLEDEIDQVLKELRKSQESEYRIAEQKLYAQKDSLLSLYQQLEIERSELANPTSLPSGSNPDSLLTNVLNRVDQIKHEEVKFRNMMHISKGFGQAPKSILKEYFGFSG